MSEAALQMSGMDDREELSCVLIPTQPVQLLLPNVCVAEIVPWRRIKPMSNGPAWCLGQVGWRGEVLNVVSYGVLNGRAQARDEQGRCLVVMNRARNSAGTAFYALAAVGLPRMLQLLEDDLHNLDVELGVADVMQVRVGTEAATIPDLAYIEDRLAELV